jgi:hypothetical protein
MEVRMADIPIPQASGLSQLPTSRVSGIYFLWRKEQIVYVGQSRNITQRIADHIQEGKKRFDGMSYIAVEVIRLDRVERYFIETLLPQYNRCGIASAMRKLRGCGFEADIKPPVLCGKKRKRYGPKAHITHDTTGAVLVIKARGQPTIRLPVMLVPTPQ